MDKLFCYPGQIIGLYNPPQIEKDKCQKGISCNFGICSECVIGVTKGVLDEAKTNSRFTGLNWNNNH